MSNDRRFIVSITEKGRPDVKATNIEAAGVAVLSQLDPKHFVMSLRGLNSAELAMAIATLIVKANDIDPAIFATAGELIRRGMVPETGEVYTHE